MNPIFRYVAVAVVAIMAVACGHSDRFVIKGEVAGGASMNLRVVYYTAGRVVTGVTAATDGKFAFDGVAPEDALVELYDNDYRLLGRLVARNGDDMEVRVDPAAPASFIATGNDITDRMTAFVSGQASATTEARNAAVATYVGAHRDDPVSALLLMTQYDTAVGGTTTADSLMSLISPESRATDITAGYIAMLARVSSATSHAPIASIPYLASGAKPQILRMRSNALTFIAVGDRAHHRDSVISVLKDLSRHERQGDFAVADLSVDGDTIDWSRSLRADSATWMRGWVGGSISGSALGRLGISRLPFYIIVDSAGRQLWRGTSSETARAKAKELISR